MPTDLPDTPSAADIRYDKIVRRLNFVNLCVATFTSSYTAMLYWNYLLCHYATGVHKINIIVAIVVSWLTDLPMLRLIALRVISPENSLKENLAFGAKFFTQELLFVGVAVYLLRICNLL